MGVNEVSSRVAAFNAEIRTLAERGDGRDIMAWTGGQLAAAAEALRQAEEPDRAAEAIYVMYVSKPHVGCLFDAGMPIDALATALMVIMTCLMAKVNPEEIPVAYKAYLEFTRDLAAAAAEAVPDEHLQIIESRLTSLIDGTVAPTQALDIAADAISRLKALGLE